MIYPDIYKEKSKSHMTVFGAGYITGVVDTYSQFGVETISQPAMEENYLILSNKIQDRINTIMENYQLNNKEDVQHFLQENSSILSLVNETYSRIHEYIPETRKVVLEVLVDPEENQTNLIAKIYPNLSIDDALDRLDNFDKQWFANKFIESNTLFNVTLDFE